jgi:hypothetical protein
MDEYPRGHGQLYLRQVVIRMYWDGETEPSVEVPIGDFFGMGHAVTKNFTSAPFAMSPENGKSFNCFFSMPFAGRARGPEPVREPGPHVLLRHSSSIEKLSDQYLLPSWRRRIHAGVDDTKVTNESTRSAVQLKGRTTT